MGQAQLRRDVRHRAGQPDFHRGQPTEVSHVRGDRKRPLPNRLQLLGHLPGQARQRAQLGKQLMCLARKPARRHAVDNGSPFGAFVSLKPFRGGRAIARKFRSVCYRLQTKFLGFPGTTLCNLSYALFRLVPHLRLIVGTLEEKTPNDPLCEMEILQRRRAGILSYLF